MFIHAFSQKKQGRRKKERAREEQGGRERERDEERMEAMSKKREPSGKPKQAGTPPAPQEAGESPSRNFALKAKQLFPWPVRVEGSIPRISPSKPKPTDVGEEMRGLASRWTGPGSTVRQHPGRLRLLEGRVERETRACQRQTIFMGENDIKGYSNILLLLEEEKGEDLPRIPTSPLQWNLFLANDTEDRHRERESEKQKYHQHTILCASITPPYSYLM